MREPFEIFGFADEAADDLDGQIRALTRNRLAGPEVRTTDGVSVSDLTRDQAARIRERLDAAGLTVRSIGSPIGKTPIEGDFPTQLERLRRTLEIGRVLGASRVRLFSFYLPGDRRPSEFREEVLDRLGRLADAALAEGFTPCHENERGIYGERAEQCLDIHRQLPAMRAVFDAGNFLLCGEDIPTAWRALRPYTLYLHVKDVRLSDGRVVPAGYGDGRLPTILREFIGDGGRCVTVEPHLVVTPGAREPGPEGGFRNRDEAFDCACRAVRALTDAVLHKDG